MPSSPWTDAELEYFQYESVHGLEGVGDRPLKDDECFRTRKPAAQLDVEDEMEEAA